MIAAPSFANAANVASAATASSKSLRDRSLVSGRVAKSFITPRASVCAASHRLNASESFASWNSRSATVRSGESFSFTGALNPRSTEGTKPPEKSSPFFLSAAPSNANVALNASSRNTAPRPSAVSDTLDRGGCFGFSSPPPSPVFSSSVTSIFTPVRSASSPSGPMSPTATGTSCGRLGSARAHPGSPVTPA